VKLAHYIKLCTVPARSTRDRPPMHTEFCLSLYFAHQSFGLMCTDHIVSQSMCFTMAAAARLWTALARGPDVGAALDRTLAGVPPRALDRAAVCFVAATGNHPSLDAVGFAVQQRLPKAVVVGGAASAAALANSGNGEPAVALALLDPGAGATVVPFEVGAAEWRRKQVGRFSSRRRQQHDAAATPLGAWVPQVRAGGMGSEGGWGAPPVPLPEPLLAAAAAGAGPTTLILAADDVSDAVLVALDRHLPASHKV